MKLHLAAPTSNYDIDGSFRNNMAPAIPTIAKNGMKLRILLSYHYYKDTDLDALFAKYFTAPYPEVFADSGAFSAASQGAHIDIAEYAGWVKRWAHLLTVYSNLDVIGDAAGTARNQSTLEDMGLDPLPVFHTGSDMAHLDALLDRYQYIALGGMVPYMRFPKRIMPWLIKCFKAATGRAVFHGFGATAWTVVKALPWYSVDSSAWGSGFRYGQVPLFDNRAGKFQTVNLGDVGNWQRHAQLVNSLGFDWRDFADRKRNDRAKICAISALSYMMAEQWLRKRHGEIYIPDRASAPGVRAHLADANPARFGEAVSGVGERLHLADTSNGINYGDADKGLKLHLADSPFNMDIPMASMGMSGSTAKDIQKIKKDNNGFKLHLAEHSLDRGG